MEKKKKKRVIVFGIFDGVHEGHRDLFRQAREMGDELVVIVGRDAIAQKLKGRKLRYSEDERVAMLKNEQLVDDAILGDRELSTYTVLVRCNPDIVCLGYDQQELHVDLERWLAQKRKSLEIHCAVAHRGETLHSSLF